MSLSTFQAVCPTFYQYFSCIGPDCSDNCCHTWQIEIDKEHYRRYLTEKDPDFAALCAKTVHRKSNHISEHSYAQMSLDEHGRCGFQDDDGGCKIYRQLGSEALSHTCTLYPRRKAEFTPHQWELSLSLSCEEAVRIGVLSPNEIAFEKAERMLDSHDPLCLIRSAGIGPGGCPTCPPPYGHLLRTVCIQLMQCRTCSVAERILAVSLFLKRIDRLVDSHNEHAIPEEAERFLSSVKSGSFSGFFNQLDYHAEFHLAALQVPLGHLLSGQSGVVQQHLLNRITPYLEPDVSGVPCAGLRTRNFILSLIRQTGAPFLSMHQTWMENYFVNYMFSSMFPFLYQSEGLSFEQHAMLLAEQYALLGIAVSALSDQGGETDEKRMTRAVVHTARLCQHGDLGSDMKRLFETFQIHNLAQAAYLLR